MPQRSFRLDQGSLDNLTRIAEHLARLDRKPPNLTTALAWSIARGSDAIDGLVSAKIPSNLVGEVAETAEVLRRLSVKWQMAVRIDSARVQAEVDKDKQITELQAEVQSLSEQLEKARAIPYRPSLASSE